MSDPQAQTLVTPVTEDLTVNSTEISKKIQILEDIMSSVMDESQNKTKDEIYSLSMATIRRDLFEGMTDSDIVSVKKQVKKQTDTDLIHRNGEYIAIGTWEGISKAKEILNSIINRIHEVNEEDASTKLAHESADLQGENSCQGIDFDQVNDDSELATGDATNIDHEMAKTDCSTKAMEPDNKGNTVQRIDKTLSKFQCKVCEKSFLDTQSLQAHCSRYNDSHEKCKFCRLSFHKINDAISHSKLHHPEMWKGSSRSANVKLKREPYEIPVSDDTQGFKCDYCNIIFLSWLVFLHHRKEKHSGTIECKFCHENEFQSMEYFLAHLEELHFDNKGKFIDTVNEGAIPIVARVRLVKCKICSVRLPSREMGRHIVSFHADKKSHDCIVCGDIFSSKTLLAEHALKHQSETGQSLEANYRDVTTKKDQCTNLSKLQRKVNSLIEVVNSHERDLDSNTSETDFGLSNNFKRIHICEFCGVKTSKSGLLRHMKRHHQTKAHTCNHCQESFVYRSDLDVHIKRHFDRSGKFRQLRRRSKSTPVDKSTVVYRCKVCCREFASLTAIKKHVSVHVDNDGNVTFLVNEVPIQSVDERRRLTKQVGNYDCEKCTRRFLRLKDLKLHKKSCKISKVGGGEDNDTLFRCDHCQFADGEMTVVLQHIKSSHRDNVYQCDICKESFPLLYTLKEHLKVDHAKIKSVCEVCGKEFRKARYLSVHMKRHVGQKTHVCPVCNKAFYEKNKLTQHQKIHDGDRDSVTCQICKKVFVSKEYLKQHMNSHQGVRPYKCGLCDKSFSLASALDKHKFTHSDERPYICPEPTCGKAFKFMNKLRYHTTIHTGVSKHVCCHCNTAFTEKYSLSKHQTICKKAPWNSRSPIPGTSSALAGPTLTLAVPQTPAPTSDQGETLKEVYMCSFCNKYFSDWEQVKLHMQEHNLTLVGEAANQPVTETEGTVDGNDSIHIMEAVVSHESELDLEQVIAMETDDIQVSNVVDVGNEMIVNADTETVLSDLTQVLTDM